MMPCMRFLSTLIRILERLSAHDRSLRGQRRRRGLRRSLAGSCCHAGGRSACLAPRSSSCPHTHISTHTHAQTHTHTHKLCSPRTLAHPHTRTPHLYWLSAWKYLGLRRLAAAMALTLAWNLAKAALSCMAGRGDEHSRLGRRPAGVTAARMEERGYLLGWQVGKGKRRQGEAGPATRPAAVLRLASRQRDWPAAVAHRRRVLVSLLELLLPVVKQQAHGGGVLQAGRKQAAALVPSRAGNTSRGRQAQGAEPASQLPEPRQAESPRRRLRAAASATSPGCAPAAAPSLSLSAPWPQHPAVPAALRPPHPHAPHQPAHLCQLLQRG